MPELNVVAGAPDAGAWVSPLAEAAKAVAAGPPGIDGLQGLAGRLEGDCPEIAAILRSSAVRTEVELCLRQDAAAIEQQRRLLREATAANVCLMLAGVLSGLVLVGAAGRAAIDQALGGVITSSAVLVLGIATLALGALAAMFSQIARDQDRLGRWLAARGAAELARLNAFCAIAREAAARGPAVAMYGLAIVVSYLLDQQRAWLGARAARHRRSSEWTSLWGGVATALAFVGGSGAVIGGFEPGKAWVAIAGVIGAAVAAYAANREALRRDRTNADRYQKTQVVLDLLAARDDAIAKEIAGGKPEALVAFTEGVAEPLAAEHKQWLEDSAQAGTALAKLDSRLQELRGGAD
jgi:hypothetical protein